MPDDCGVTQTPAPPTSGLPWGGEAGAIDFSLT